MVARNEPNTADRELIISRVIHFPREWVWDAMTDPAHVINWWGPRGFTTTIDKMDVKPGGTWKFVMHGPDGTDYVNQSTFTEVEKPSRLVYVHGGSKPGGPKVQFVGTWTFDEVEKDVTRVTIRQVYASPEERNTVVNTYGADKGGQECLARLAEFVIRKGEPFVIERTYDAPIEKVWHGITDRTAISKWFFDFVGFRPEVGDEFSFLVDHKGKKCDHRCRVSEIVPQKKISYTWRYEGFPGDSLVTFELFNEGGKTRLKLTHEGLDHFKPNFDRSDFARGWNMLIGEELVNYLDGKL